MEDDLVENTDTDLHSESNHTVEDMELGDGDVQSTTVTEKTTSPSANAGTKRKAAEEDKTEVTVRKSSRIKQLIDLRKEKETTLLQGKSVHDAQKEKTKMLQKPTERPNRTRLDEEEENSETEKTSDNEKEEDRVVDTTHLQGDRSRPPGADTTRKIDQDFLLPFSFGWTREVVIRPVKTGPPQIDIFYWPPKDGDHGPRNREAKRKRRSKVDQERYFEEFTHPRLSVNNFSYVRRPLGLNNEAYEIVRCSKPSLETRSDKRTRSSGKVASYKEVAEHEGLLSSNSEEEEDDEIEEITEFDQGLPLSLQALHRVTPLREESKRRRKLPDRENCVTPPLAEDLPWSVLDDDPLGIYTDIGGRSS